jgi:hypothetical protein
MTVTAYRGEAPQRRRLESRAEILEWAEERRRVLTALMAEDELARARDQQAPAQLELIVEEVSR